VMKKSRALASLGIPQARPVAPRMLASVPATASTAISLLLSHLVTAGLTAVLVFRRKHRRSKTVAKPSSSGNHFAMNDAVMKAMEEFAARAASTSRDALSD
jgi:hypothetical protein